jgi:hypothetical protein
MARSRLFQYLILSVGWSFAVSMNQQNGVALPAQDEGLADDVDFRDLLGK